MLYFHGLACLRGLGHPRRREMVRSDKFAEPFDNVMHEIMGYVGFARYLLRGSSVGRILMYM